MAIQLEFLKSILYFSDLDLAELESISKLVFEKTADRAEMVLLEGESAENLYFVASGVVKVFKTSAEGKEQILSIVRPGESFNDVPIFDGGPNPAGARAMGPVILYGIKKHDMEAILRDHPKVAMNVIKVLARRVRQWPRYSSSISEVKRVAGRGLHSKKWQLWRALPGR